MAKPDIKTIYPDEPYRGIESFRFMDQNIFFGREQEIQSLLQLTTIYKGVLLFGVQGIGKSSVISAGLIPLALKRNFIPDRIRVQPVEGAELVIEPLKEHEGNENEITFLPSSFIAYEERNKKRTISLDEFIEIIHKNENTTSKKYFEASRHDLSAHDSYRPLTPLLIFDQFEEIITLFEEGVKDNTREEKLGIQKNIFNTLSKLLYDNMANVNILFSFREDYQPNLEKFLRTVPDIKNQSMRLEVIKTSGTLDTDDDEETENVNTVENIIRKPVTEVNAPEHYRNKLSREALDVIVGYFNQKLISNPDNNCILSEVQIVCQALWNSPLQSELLAKGCDSILSDFFKERMKKISPELILIAHEILMQLVLNNSRNIVSKITLFKELSEILPEFKTALFEAALKELKSDKIKLIKEDHRSNDIICYDIINEYLIPSIHEIAEERNQKRIEAENIKRTEEEKKRNALLELKYAEEKRERAKLQEMNRKLNARSRISWTLTIVCVIIAAIAINYYKMAIREQQNATKALTSYKKQKVKEVAKEWMKHGNDIEYNKATNYKQMALERYQKGLDVMQGYERDTLFSQLKDNIKRCKENQ